MEKLIVFHIQNVADREKMVVALANSGYKVKVVVEDDPQRLIGQNYFVHVWMEDSDGTDR